MLFLSSVRASLVRFAVIGVIASAMISVLPVSAHAERNGEAATQTSTMMVQFCEAMGGTAEVTVIRTANGRLTIEVKCVGGYLDGLDCINDADIGGWCKSSGRLEFDPDTQVSVLAPMEVKPLDEPVQAPDVQELPATPTPEPSPIVTVVDPVLSDPVVTDDGATATPTPETGGEIISDPVITDPMVVDGGEVAPVDTSDGTIITDPVRDPMRHLPLGGEEIKAAPGQ